MTIFEEYDEPSIQVTKIPGKPPKVIIHYHSYHPLPYEETLDTFATHSGLSEFQRSAFRTDLFIIERGSGKQKIRVAEKQSRDKIWAYTFACDQAVSKGCENALKEFKKDSIKDVFGCIHLFETELARIRAANFNRWSQCEILTLMPVKVIE